MATAIIEIDAPDGQALTLELYPFGSDTLAVSALTLTEHSNNLGLYEATTTDGLTGWHNARAKNASGVTIARGAVYMTDEAAVHRVVDAPIYVNADGQVDLGLLQGSQQSAADLKDFADTGYDPSAHRATANASHIGGTAQTGRDLGANVLLSSGTGTGQVLLSSGVVRANDSGGNAIPTAAQTAAATEAAILNEGDATALLAAIAAKVEQLLINDGDATTTLAAIATAVRTNLATELARIDAAVSTRATPAQVNSECDTALADYDAPTNAEMVARTLPNTQYATATGQGTAQTDLTNILADTNELQTDWANGGRLDLLIDGTKAKTDLIPAAGFPANFNTLAVSDTGSVTVGTIANGVISSATFTVSAVTGVATGILEQMRQLWRWRFKKKAKNTNDSTFKTYADDGTTVLTNQPYNSTGGVDTVSDAT